jgi:ABC-2 type transport system ATP-binding protein
MESVFQECIAEARNEGKSVLLSSHILSEVEKLCDKISIIRAGRIIESGSLDELRHLTRTSLFIETKNPIASLHELKGVHDIETRDKAVYFQLDTEELDNIMKYVSQFGIVKLESAPPTLEDLFMRHYKGDGGES